jgi:hypothetical protein
VDFLVKREYENRNEDLEEVVKRERAITDKIVREAKQLEDIKKRKMLNQMTDDHLRGAEKNTAYPIII